MKSNRSRENGSNGRAKKISLLGVVVSVAIYVGSALAVGTAIYFGVSHLTKPRPVAAVGLMVCGKVQAVTVVMSDGKMKRYTGPDKEGAALIAKVPAENFSSYGINTALCSPPKVY